MKIKKKTLSKIVWYIIAIAVIGGIIILPILQIVS